MSTTTGRATLVHAKAPSSAGAVQHIYRLDPPLEYTRWDGETGQVAEYVIVSADVVGGIPETSIFASDGEGVTGWTELPGSYQGGLNHRQALSIAGYVVDSE